MYQDMINACTNYNDGLITAGELRHRLVTIMLENELTFDVMKCPEFDKLAIRLTEG